MRERDEKGRFVKLSEEEKERRRNLTEYYRVHDINESYNEFGGFYPHNSLLEESDLEEIGKGEYRLKWQA